MFCLPKTAWPPTSKPLRTGNREDLTRETWSGRRIWGVGHRLDIGGIWSSGFGPGSAFSGKPEGLWLAPRDPERTGRM